MKTSSIRMLQLSTALVLAMAGLVQAQDDVQELENQANAAMQAEDFEKAAEAFQKLVKADPENDRAWHLLGYSLHSLGKLDEAIKAHKKAASFEGSQFANTALYNLGCAYSLKNELDMAFKYMDKAVDAGFLQMNYFETDADLENMRKDERFAALVARVKNGGKRPEMDDEDKKSKTDKKSSGIAGEWQITKGQKAGEDVSAERLPPQVTISDKAFRMPSGAGEDFVMAYKIDDSKKPMHVDLEITAGPAPSSKAMGIIAMDGGKLKLCYDPTGQNRPEKFETDEDNGFFMFVMTRKAGKFDASKLIGDWKVTEGMRAGEKSAAERLAAVISIAKGEIVIPAGEDEFVMEYKIDASKNPIQIDMSIAAGPAPEGSKALGILKMDGDAVVLCYDSMGQTRPEKFESTAENGFFLFRMERSEK